MGSNPTLTAIISIHNHLGSPVAATNASGALLWREDYTPFGEARQQPAANDNGESYTGHIADIDTGLIYMQARYYDPAIGRFLSSDPVGFASGGPAYFNRYAYVGNNPLNATDPTGERQVVKLQAGGQVSGARNQTVLANAGVYAGQDSRGRLRVGVFGSTGVGGATRPNAASMSGGFAVASGMTTDNIAGQTVTVQGDIDIPGSIVDLSGDISLPADQVSSTLAAFADGNFDLSNIDMSQAEVAVEAGLGMAGMGSVTLNQTYEAGLTVPNDMNISGSPNGDVNFSYTSPATEQQKAFNLRELFVGREERYRGD